MSIPETTAALDKLSSRVEEELKADATELGDDELNDVYGGVNPQPLPPRHVRFI